MRVKVTGGVSSTKPPKEPAKHITTVPLFSWMAGMDRVPTLVPFSLIITSSAPGKPPDGDPFTIQPRITLGQ